MLFQPKVNGWYYLLNEDASIHDVQVNYSKTHRGPIYEVYNHVTGETQLVHVNSLHLNARRAADKCDEMIQIMIGCLDSFKNRHGVS